MMEPQTTPFDIFLSYHWRDHDAVEQLARALDARGLRVFLDRWYLAPGLPWPRALEQALEQCRAVAVCIGPGNMGPWQMREQFLALVRQGEEERQGLSFPVIPVLLPGAELPLCFLKLNTWVSLRTGVEDAQAVEAIARTARGLLPEAVRARPAVCPYRGLQAFREEDAPFFCGRDAFSDRLVEEIRRKSFIAVVGASGSGKSSVVRAGLVPRLRRAKSGEAPVWDILTLTPHKQPLDSLAEAILRVLEPEDMSEAKRLAELDLLVRQFSTQPKALQRAARRCIEKQPGTDRLLLFVDQWEELYTACKDELARRWFIDQLLTACADAPVTVLLTMRGDFYGRALTHRGLVDRLQDCVVNLGPMTREELRSTIENPAREVGLEFEPGLVDHILDEVGDEPGNLPLLEFMLRQLWENRRGHLLHFEAYKDMKGIQGAIAIQADKIFQDELTDEQREAARRVLMRLVRPGEGVPDTRRRAALPTEDENALAVIHKLADARLLVTGRDEARTDARTVEIAHEALIQQWGLLRQWIDEDREFLRTRERIEAAAGLWEQEGMVDDRLLTLGRPLAEAEDLLEKRRLDLSPSLIAFIEASTAAERRRQEALQEAERNAQRQKLRRNRNLAVAFGLVALTMAGLGLLALERWRTADRATEEARASKEAKEQERQKALSRALSAQASLLVERGPSEETLLRAATLAVESWNREPNPDAYSVAMKLLEWFPVRRIEPDPGVPRAQALAAFSPDGRFLVMYSSSAVRLVEMESGREVTRIEMGEDVVPPVWFSPDSRFVSIRRTLIDTRTGKEVFTASADKVKIPGNFHIDGGERTKLGNMSPDSRWLVLESIDGAGKTDGIVLVDMHIGKEACRIEHRKDREEAPLWLSFNPDGSLLAIMDWRAESARLIRLVEVPSGRERASLTMNHAGSGHFLGKGQYLAIEVSGDSGKNFHFVAPESGRELGSIPLGKNAWPQFSSDGQRMVQKDKEVRLLEVPTGKELAHWRDDIERAFLDSTGQQLVLVSQSGLIRLIDTASGQEKSQVKPDCEIERPTYAGHAASLRADADLLIVSCKDGEFRVFKPSTGAERARYKVEGRVLFLSPDSRLIVTMDKDQEVLRFHETATGQEFGKVATNGPVGPIIPPPSSTLLWMPSPAFSSDGRYLALPGPTGSVQLVELSSACSPLKLDSATRWRPILSRDRRRLVFSGSDQVVRVVDMATGREIGSLHNDEPTFPVHISSDGRLLLTRQESILKLNEIETGREVARRIQNERSYYIENSPDGNYLITSGAEGSAWIVESNSLGEISRFSWPSLYGAPAFSPDGKLLALGDRGDYVFHVIDTASGKEQLRIGPGKGFGSPRFSPDGKILAVDGVLDGFVRLFDIFTGTQRMQLAGRGTPNFSPDGRALASDASSSYGKGVFVKLFDLESERELVGVHSGSNYDYGSTSEPLAELNFAFSPDSLLFAVGAAAGDPVRLFDARTGKELVHMELGWGFKGVLFSPDGRALATASNNGSVRLLDVQNLRVLGTSQHAKAVTHMEFSPDNRFLVTSSGDGTALMMETGTGKTVARFEHGAPLVQANFSQDGQSLLTVSDDRLKLWHTDPKWPFDQLCERSGRNLSREKWRTFIGESEAWRPTCPDWHNPEVGASGAGLPSTAP